MKTLPLIAFAVITRAFVMSGVGGLTPPKILPWLDFNIKVLVESDAPGIVLIDPAPATAVVVANDRTPSTVEFTKVTPVAALAVNKTNAEPFEALTEAV